MNPILPLGLPSLHPKTLPSIGGLRLREAIPFSLLNHCGFNCPSSFPCSEFKLGYICRAISFTPFPALYRLGTSMFSEFFLAKQLVHSCSSRPLLSSKTALVTLTHASNILGTIHDIRASKQSFPFISLFPTSNFI